MFNKKSILITGGTGSFGQKFTQRILEKYNPERLIIYSRDEYKQYLMRQKFIKYDEVLRFFIGDVRDQERLYRAFDEVDIVIHAAAMKQIPIAEYNPIEAVKTNIMGAKNVINAAIDRGVEKIVALSTDKAANPINLYGATKLVSDKLFISANAYVGKKKTTFSVVRYGNVVGSRGSVIPLFKKLIEKGEKVLPITDFRMTRFWITLDQGVDLVFRALKETKGGEIFVAKIPSFKVIDLAKAMKPDAELKEIGIRIGEKLHELMITVDDSRLTYDYGDYFIIYPNFDWWTLENHFRKGGRKLKDGFIHSSDNNSEWLSIDNIRKKIKEIDIVY